MYCIQLNMFFAVTKQIVEKDIPEDKAQERLAFWKTQEDMFESYELIKQK